MPSIFGFLLYTLTSWHFCIYLYTIGLIVSIALRVVYGGPNFNYYPKLKTRIYDAGIAKAWTTKYGNELQIYYPIER